MEPYAKPKEQQVGAHRPKIRHLPHATAREHNENAKPRRKRLQHNAAQ